jgi:hypothetical protein
MDTVQVVKDICQLVSFVWPDEELGTSRGASGSPSPDISSKQLMKKSAMTEQVVNPSPHSQLARVTGR